MDGLIVNAEVLDYGDRQGPPMGRVIEILGSPDDFGIDVEIVIRKHHLPNRFPSDVIDQAQSIPAFITGAELAGRRDFRDLPIVTIDGETARDFDDAVLVDKLAERPLRAAGSYRGCQPLRHAGKRDRRRSAIAGDQRLFPGPRRAHAAVRVVDEYLFAGAACGPARGLRVDRVRPARRASGV